MKIFLPQSDADGMSNYPTKDGGRQWICYLCLSRDDS